MGEGGREQVEFTAGLYEFFCSAAAGHRAMLDAEYFILL